MTIDQDSVRAIVAELGGVAGVDRIADEVIRRGLLDEEWRQHAMRRLTKAEIRKVMQAVDEEELPDIVNVKREKPDGSTEQVYVQRKLMEVADYEYAVKYRVDRAGHVADSARAFAAECEQRHGVAIQLPMWMPIPVPA